MKLRRLCVLPCVCCVRVYNDNKATIKIKMFNFRIVNFIYVFVNIVSLYLFKSTGSVGRDQI